MFPHQAIIIPEVNSSHEVCDHTDQTAKALSSYYPVYIFYANLPPVTFPQFISQTEVRVLKLLPFSRFTTIFKINSYLSFQILYLYVFLKHKVKPTYWIFYPQLANLIKFSFPSKILIFDILDGFSSTPLQNYYFLKKAKVVSVMTKALLNHYLQNYGAANYLLTHPASYLAIPSATIDSAIIQYRHLPYIVGYIGSINERLDFNLIIRCLKTYPQANFLFAGPINHDNNVRPKPIIKLFKKLQQFPNFHYLGVLPKNQVPHFLNMIKVGIIPYDLSQQFNRLSFPLKSVEYSLAHKPFVSTEIPEINNATLNPDRLSWPNKIKLILQQKIFSGE